MLETHIICNDTLTIWNDSKRFMNISNQLTWTDISHIAPDFIGIR